jgi:hypothetical protein
MWKYAVCLAVILGVLLLPALSLAQGAADTVVDHETAIEELATEEEALDEAAETDALAAAGITCQFSASEMAASLTCERRPASCSPSARRETRKP